MLRDLVWDGCLNVRDLGGLPTEDGSATRFGSVIRADSLGFLTDEGCAALAASGVSRIVDLRDGREQAEDPPRKLPVPVVHVPILARLDADGWAEVVALSAGARTHAEAHRLVYLRFLDRCRRGFVEAVAAVAEAPEGAVVVHCLGGKDRTGLVVALLLRLAGVPADVIATDYALSARRLRPRHRVWLAEAGDGEGRRRMERILSSPAAAMRGVLAELDREYGGVARSLLDGGLDSSLLEAARSRLRA